MCVYVWVRTSSSVCVCVRTSVGVHGAPGYMTIRCDRDEWKMNPLMWRLGGADRKQPLDVSVLSGQF